MPLTNFVTNRPTASSARAAAAAAAIAKQLVPPPPLSIIESWGLIVVV